MKKLLLVCVLMAGCTRHTPDLYVHGVNRDDMYAAKEKNGNWSVTITEINPHGEVILYSGTLHRRSKV